MRSQLMKRGNLFYGWIVVACVYMVFFLAYGLQYSFGIFLSAILAEFGWSRADVSLAFSVYCLVYKSGGWPSGQLTDGFGPRVVLAIGSCLLGGGLMAISRIDALWQLYLLYGVVAGIGMSTVRIPCNATVVKWFEGRRGLALSLTSSGGSCGIFAIPPLAASLIALVGWRTAYLMCGAMVIVCLSGLARFLVRDPEFLGLAPDGGQGSSVVAARSSQGAAALSTAEDWTIREAVRTTTFWTFAMAVCATMLALSIPMVHIVAFARDLGMSPTRAAFSLSVVGIAAVIGTFTMGPLSDRIGRKRALGLSFVFQAAACLGWSYSDGSGLLYLSAGMFGLYYGSVHALWPGLAGDFFGRRHVGAITGRIYGLAGPGMAAGPYMAGALYDATGAYRLAFALGAGISLLALVLLLVTKRPCRASVQTPICAAVCNPSPACPLADS